MNHWSGLLNTLYPGNREFVVKGSAAAPAKLKKRLRRNLSSGEFGASLGGIGTDILKAGDDGKRAEPSSQVGL